MQLGNVVILNGIATAIKLLAALFLNKILAVYLGPSGYASIGQFQNIMNIATNVGGGIVSNGITKGTAELNEKINEQHNVWKSGFKLSIILSVITSSALYLFKTDLSNLIHINNNGIERIYIILSIIMPLCAVNSFILAVLNGKKEIKSYVFINIINSILSLVLVGVGALINGPVGALEGMCLVPLLSLTATYFLIRRKKWLKISYITGKVSIKSIKPLIGFSLMGITTAICTPLTLIFIRELIISKIGIEAAGYWQAVTKISDIYLMIITMTLSLYYLPRIAEITNSHILKREIKKVNLFLLPTTIVGAILIYILRYPIIDLLFTDQFKGASELFAWQLIGDVIKISSWILSFIMIGKYMIKSYISTEIIFSITYYYLNYIFINHYGLNGAPIAFATNYLIYLVIMIILIDKKLKKM